MTDPVDAAVARLNDAPKKRRGKRKPPRVPSQIRIPIEQVHAYAPTWTPEQIAKYFDFPVDTVVRVLGELEAINREDDDPADDTDPDSRPMVGLDRKPCGTLAAYRRHTRKKEQPCRACRAANARGQDAPR